MKRTEQVNSIATQSITPRRKRRASKKKSATLTRADVNLIVNRKFAQTLEKKFFDATFAFSAGTAAGQFPSSDGWIEDLSDMTQGVGITQRVGDRIAPTSLEFRWLIFTPNAAGLITGSGKTFCLQVSPNVIPCSKHVPGTILPRHLGTWHQLVKTQVVCQQWGVKTHENSL